MYDVAIKIGQSAIDIYASASKPHILEFGSMNLNGRLRQFAPAGASYLGVDIASGEGVDMIVNPDQPLPFKDNTFDLVLAPSVFQHDPAFWTTFLELGRILNDGGHLYVNAQSDGKAHRNHQDLWRFRPDCGLALERWAIDQNMPMRLVESFTASAEDTWDDFIAIFRKGVDMGGLSGRFVHTHCRSTNIWTMGATEVLRPSTGTQDQNLKGAAEDRATKLEQELAAERARAEEIAGERSIIESTLRQREEEIEQTRKKLEELSTRGDSATQALEEKLTDANAWIFKLAGERQKLQKRADRLDHLILKLEKELKSERLAAQRQSDFFDRQIEDMENECKGLRQDLDANRSNLDHTSATIQSRFDELAKLTRLLQASEADTTKAQAHTLWMGQVFQCLSRCPVWWALLPKSWRRKRELDRLEKRNLFHSRRYLELYSDVAQEGIDPLAHFVLHGMHENRVLPRSENEAA